jgi:hypothetical protein
MILSQSPGKMVDMLGAKGKGFWVNIFNGILFIVF